MRLTLEMIQEKICTRENTGKNTREDNTDRILKLVPEIILENTSEQRETKR